MKLPKREPAKRRRASLAGVVVLISVQILLVRVVVGLSPTKAITQYAHHVWTPDEGLPQVTVQAMVQTRDGYIWIGTQEGFARFDGARFQVFNRRNTPIMTRNRIEALAEGRDGSLWIGTYGGGLLRYLEGGFTRYTTADGLSSDMTQCLLVGRHGELWVGTDVGLDRLKNGRATAFGAAHGLPRGEITALLEDRRGLLWVGTRSGLYRLTGDQFRVLTVDNGLSSDTVLSLCEAADGGLWIGTDRGLDHLHNRKVDRFTTTDGLTSNTILVLCRDRDGNLWIGTLNGGLVRYNASGFGAYTSRQGLTHDRVISLLEDREGSLWIGTFAGGLNRLSDASFTTLSTREGLSHDDVQTILQDRSGAVWIGTERGLNRLVDGKLKSFPGQGRFARFQVTGLFEDRNGALWVGTYGGGMDRLAGSKWTAITTSDGLPSNQVFAFAQTPDGALWVGTDGGLARLAAGRIHVFTTTDGLPRNSVRALFVDHRGTLWIGTRGGGVAILVGNGVRRFNLGLSPNQENVKAVHEEADGTLWFATTGGLIRLAQGKAFAFTIRDGLAEDNVHQVLEDGAGNLWVSSNRGIMQVAKTELDAFARGDISTIHNTLYGRADGMLSCECNGGSQPAGCKTRDGRLCFPTVHGMVTVDPSRLGGPQPPPPVLIEQVLVDGVSYELGVKAVVAAGSRNFEIHYTAPTFLTPERVRFRYMLEGLDRRWVDAGRRRTAYFNRLPHGNYRFRVTARIGDGAWNWTSATFALRVKPHSYETVPFFLVATLLVGLSIGTGHRFRTRQLRRRQAQLVAAVEDRTRELTQLAAEMKELSLRDPLTGLRNRRYLFETIEPVIQDLAQMRTAEAEGQPHRRGMEYSTSVGLLMVDLDHFKDVNDRYGHESGDLVLRTIAEVLTASLRPRDLAIRWGGEEFLLVLVNTDSAYLPAVAQRVLERVASTDLTTIDGATIRRSCSIGVASYPFYPNLDRELSVEQLIGVADLALYLAKREGRDRSVRLVAGSHIPEDDGEVSRMLGSTDVALGEGFVKVNQ